VDEEDSVEEEISQRDLLIKSLVLIFPLPD
jgi:hypothetical protein